MPNDAKLSDAGAVQKPDAAAEVIAAYPWQTDRCLVLPYRPDKFPPRYLYAVWAQMRSEGLLDYLFPDSPMPWEQFEATVATVELKLGLVKPNLDLAFAAIVWDITGERGTRRAYCGFVTFRRYWATRLLREIARVAIRSVYSEAGVDRLIGTILAENLPARAFSAALGFEELAVLSRWVPTRNGFRDAVMVALDREQFEHGTDERTDLRQEHGRDDQRPRP